MKKLIIVIFSIILIGCGTSNYYLVRHAEKIDNSSDPDLSLAGKNRADALRDSLVDNNIYQIYATQYKRTQQTVKPLADALGKETIIYDAGSTTEMVTTLKGLNKRNIVVAGHSNTIPEMVLMLTGETVHIGHDEYYHLFHVQKKKTISGTTYKLFQKKYGVYDF